MKRICRLFSVTAIIAVLATACDTGAWVAKAGPYTLSTDTFAEIVADWEYFPLREGEVERWAHRWVEWTLFTDRVAEGDSLADSATVYYAVWPEVHQLLFQGFQDQVLRDSVPMSPDIVDSVYTAGDYRLIYHILLRPRPGAGQAERQATLREIHAVRSRLLAGGSFAVENERNRDDWARVRGGSLGVVVRGQMVPAFDSVIFQLDPGAISEIIETENGYHVAWRPLLADAREEFAEGYRELRITELDVMVQENLPLQYDLTYAEDAYELVRAAARDPLAHLNDPAVIATYAGNAFTVQDFIRRLRMEPPDLRADLQVKTDEFIQFQLDQFMQRELFVLAALDAGVTLSPDLDAELRFGHKQNMADVVENMQLDRYLESDAPQAARRAAVQAAVLDHFRSIASQERIPRYVPTYLSDILRDHTPWRVSPRGVAAVVERVSAESGPPATTDDRSPG